MEATGAGRRRRAAGERGAAPAAPSFVWKAEGRRRRTAVAPGPAPAALARGAPGSRRPYSAPPPRRANLLGARWQPRRPSTLRVSSGRGPRATRGPCRGGRSGPEGWARRAPPGTRSRELDTPIPGWEWGERYRRGSLSLSTSSGISIPVSSSVSRMRPLRSAGARPRLASLGTSSACPGSPGLKYPP